MISMARESGASVLLVGMQVPPNYGAYGQQFANLFPTIAAELDTALVPFLLEPLVGRRELFQADGTHPTAEAQALIFDTVLPELGSLGQATRQHR
ncbi:MAG: hypothetical protein R3E83_22730 [Burkholderiaceae bacterium]